MIAPPARSRRAASWSTTTVPRTLTRCTSSKTARSRSAIGASGMMPAVVHEHVDAAELALRGVEQRRRLLLVRDVAADRERTAAGVGDRAHDLLGACRVAAVVDDDRRFVGGQPQRAGPPDAARAAGDDRDPLAAARHD